MRWSFRLDVNICHSYIGRRKSEGAQPSTETDSVKEGDFLIKWNRTVKMLTDVNKLNMLEQLIGDVSGFA